MTRLKNWECDLANVMAADDRTTIEAMGLAEQYWAGEIDADTLIHRLKVMKIEAEENHDRFPLPGCDCRACKTGAA